MIKTDIWQFFDRRVLLTMKKRRSGKPSRFPVVQKELKRVGLSDYHVFEAVEAIGPHQSFTLSQKQILTDFVKSEDKVLLTLEDDVEFKGMEPLYDAVDDIRRTGIKWDVLYLGGNLMNGKVIEKRRNLCRVTNVWTTHAVAYTRFAAAALLQHFPNENEVMYDTYLGSMLRGFRSYMVSPMVAFQRPDFSDIWQNDVNYTGIFLESNKKMK
jgi:hypothetical protein